MTATTAPITITVIILITTKVMTATTKMVMTTISSVQSLDRVGRRGKMRDDSADFLSQSFLQEALVSSSGMGRDVHFLIQHSLCCPRHRPPAKVPWRMVSERLLWRVTCPNHCKFARNHAWITTICFSYCSLCCWHWVKSGTLCDVDDFSFVARWCPVPGLQLPGPGGRTDGLWRLEVQSSPQHGGHHGLHQRQLCASCGRHFLYRPW